MIFEITAALSILLCYSYISNILTSKEFLSYTLYLQNSSVLSILISLGGASVIIKTSLISLEKSKEMLINYLVYSILFIFIFYSFKDYISFLFPFYLDTNLFLLSLLISINVLILSFIKSIKPKYYLMLINIIPYPLLLVSIFTVNAIEVLIIGISIISCLLVIIAFRERIIIFSLFNLKYFISKRFFNGLTRIPADISLGLIILWPLNMINN